MLVIEVERVAELSVLKYLIIGLLIVPLKPLQEAQDHAILIVVPLGQHQVLDCQEVAEIRQVSLFTLSQIAPLEEEPLVVARRDDEEGVIETGLKLSHFIIDDFYGYLRVQVPKLAVRALASCIRCCFNHFYV